jgi:hypothetical protein
MTYLEAKQILRFRLALASKPGDKFFLCHVPTQNLENTWNASALEAIEDARRLWVKAVSRRPEGVDAYKIMYARDEDAFSEPQWPTESLEELIMATFNDRQRRAPGFAALDRRQAGLVSGHFTSIVVCDFEYEIADGDLPNVLCMVAHVLDANLRHVRTIKLWRGVEGKPLPPISVWRGDFGQEPPFDIGGDTLFVAYSAWAEMTCFMQLGWRFPKHIFDQHTAYLAKTNILLPYSRDEKPKKTRKRLPDACRTYGIEGWERIDKDTIAADIGRGNWEKYGRDRAVGYCEEDVRMSTRLLRAQIYDRATSVEHVLHWSNYSAKATAQVQARGMPIDMALWNLVQENKAAVIEALLRQFDPSYGDDDPIYTPDGHWSDARFEQYLVRRGIVAWPRLDSGKLKLKGDAFRLMYHEPGIERLHRSATAYA